MAGSNRMIISILRGMVPQATLEGLLRGELFVPYEMLDAQIKKHAGNALLEVTELSPGAAGSFLLSARHSEFGAGTFAIRPQHCEITLDSAIMVCSIEVVKLEANTVTNTLLAKVAQWFPQQVIKYLLDEQTLTEGIKTQVDAAGAVQIDITEYLQNLPLAGKKLPIVNKSPLAWVRLYELTAEEAGLRIKLGLHGL